MENIIYGVLGTVGICIVLFVLGKRGFDRLSQIKRFR